MKKYLLIAGLCLTSTQLWAQSVTVSPDKILELKIKASDVGKISDALADKPFKDVADLMQSLRQQIFEQVQPKPEDKKDVPSAPIAPN